MTRPFTLLLAAVALCAGPLAFAADAFPSKPITIVTPFSAGSASAFRTGLRKKPWASGALHVANSLHN
ncbi:MAG TPA: hypothetical protein VLJ58_05895 [Ramlibacter sp.]|nr:hypothetical protein [Ramlibacter sp.]